MSENLDDIAKEIKEMQGVTNEIIRDTIKDYRKESLIKTCTIWALILLLAASFFYYQWQIKSMAQKNEERLYNFLSEYEFVYEEYSQDGQGYNNINTGTQGDVINGTIPEETQNDEKG